MVSLVDSREGEEAVKSHKWRVGRAAAYGAVLGVPILYARGYLLGDAPPHDTTELVGYLVGGILGGALLFALAAAARNLFVR